MNPRRQIDQELRTLDVCRVKLIHEREHLLVIESQNETFVSHLGETAMVEASNWFLNRFSGKILGAGQIASLKTVRLNIFADILKWG